MRALCGSVRSRVLARVSLRARSRAAAAALALFFTSASLRRRPRRLKSVARGAVADAGAAAAAAADARVSKLANGLTLATPDRGGAAASLGIYVKAGSRHEVLPGTAHLLEHIAFHSTCVGRAQRAAGCWLRARRRRHSRALCSPPPRARPPQHPALDGQAAARH